MTEFEELLAWMTYHPTISSREHWAELLGYSKRTIDNWYSERTIPMPALQHLKRIRESAESPAPTGDVLRFSVTEWNRIDAARRSLGYPDTADGRAQFFTNILTRYAAGLIPPPVDKPRPLYSPEIASSRLNEDEPPLDEPRKQPA